MHTAHITILFNMSQVVVDTVNRKLFAVLLTKTHRLAASKTTPVHTPQQLERGRPSFSHQLFSAVLLLVVAYRPGPPPDGEVSNSAPPQDAYGISGPTSSPQLCTSPRWSQQHGLSCRGLERNTIQYGSWGLNLGWCDDGSQTLEKNYRQISTSQLEMIIKPK